MKINSPTVGPIVGYTTANEVRLWFRGKFELVGESEYRRCFGLLRYRQSGDKVWSQPLFNKMSANFDMTCVLGVKNLIANTLYEYQAGWIFADSDLEKISQTTADFYSWPAEQDTYSFQSASDNSTDSRSYIIGSCRYLLKTFFGNIFDDRGDKVFDSILKQHTKAPVNGIVMMGDQIYADDLNFLKPDTKLPEFLLRYRTVFSQKYIQKLMSNIPTYMILDDHEIEDNWPEKATEKDRITVYPHAIHAYQIYQCSHSPLFSSDLSGRIEGTLQKFWYTFSDGCSEWFVMDSRTERVINKQKSIMIGQDQLLALTEWIRQKNGKTKLIVTSVPFAPDMTSEKNDKWGAFSDQRDIILDVIYKESDHRIIFLSGDVHCSFAAKIFHKSQAQPVAYQVVSSSFFWPYPHAKKGDFETHSSLITQNQISEYSAVITTDVFSDDGFCRIDIDETQIKSTFFERKGGKLGDYICTF